MDWAISICHGIHNANKKKRRVGISVCVKSSSGTMPRGVKQAESIEFPAQIPTNDKKIDNLPHLQGVAREKSCFQFAKNIVLFRESSLQPFAFPINAPLDLSRIQMPLAPFVRPGSGEPHRQI